MQKSLNQKYNIEKTFKSEKIKTILFISGKNSFYKTKANIFSNEILKNKKKYYFFKESKFPDFQELKKIIKEKERIKPDLIIAVGGGCVLDYAKVASNFSLTKDLEKRIVNSDLEKNVRNKTKVLAIPTTAGSGAESTSNAVIYINNIKYSVEGNSILPDYYFLEPKFLQSTNLITDASAGFDAISQSVESMFSLKSNTKSLNYSFRALKILLENFESFIKNKNLSNSYNMAIGANLSGKAINISKTALPHALSYPFSILYGVTHGHAVSLTFNEFLKFNYFNLAKNSANFSLDKRFKILFDITKTKTIFELDNYFQSIKKFARLEQNFKMLGINIQKDYNKILKGINEERLKNNPIKLKREDLSYFLKE
jgi:alcohol dehydrogenase class IV